MESNSGEGTMKFIWEGPRWAAVSSFLKDQAFLLDLTCEAQVEKGWVRERGRMKVEGDKKNVTEFARRMAAAFNEYNNR